MTLLVRKPVWSGIIAAICCTACGGETPPVSSVLVRVDDRLITDADLKAAFLIRGIPPAHQSALRDQQLERLIDEALISSFLKMRGIRPTAAAVDVPYDKLVALIRRRGEEPDKLFARLQIEPSRIRDRLSDSLAWDLYVGEVLTEDQIRDWFAAHRRELDGTQVRARHILIKLTPESSSDQWAAAEEKLRQLRDEIVAGKRTFATAAQELSEAPSAAQGGDVGFFAYRGTMSAEFANAAFQLDRGNVSQPVRTPAGAHLIEVTEERPGQLNLEDVRHAVIAQLSARLWDEQVKKSRSEARIDWTPSARGR